MTRFDWSVSRRGGSTSGHFDADDPARAIEHAHRRAHETFGPDQGARECLQGSLYELTVYDPDNNAVVTGLYRLDFDRLRSGFVEVIAEERKS